MNKLLLSTATLLSVFATSSYGYQVVTKNDCSIITNDGPVYTTCIVDANMSQGVWLLVIKTVDGKKYKVNGDIEDDTVFVQSKSAYMYQGAVDEICYRRKDEALIYLE